MGLPQKPSPVKLLIGIIFRDPQDVKKLKPILTSFWGESDLGSSVFCFDQTQYYQKEMGKNLKKIFLSFQKLIFPDNLPSIKIQTNCIEKEFSRFPDKESRNVNLDPGYLTLSGLVLASTKNFAHRIYLDKGIYGEVTLVYTKGSFQSLPWTFPDFRRDDYHHFLLETRQLLSNALSKKSSS